MDTYKRLGKNTLIFTIGNIGSSLITFIMLPIYTNFLSTVEYGLIDFITVSINFLLPILTFNIAESILRFGIDKKYDNKSVFMTCLYILGLISIITTPIALIILRNANFNINSIILVLITINSCLYPILQQFTRAIGEVKTYAISDILYTFIFASLNVIFIVKLNFGVEGYFLAFLIAKIIASIYIIIVAKLYNYFDIRCFNKRYAYEFIKYSTPLIPNALSWWIVNLSDRYTLSFFCGNSVLGIYSAANKIPTILSTIYNIFFKAWQISSFEEYGTEKRDELYNNVMKYLSVFMTLIAMAMIVFINLIMKIFIGDNFYEAIYYIPILIIAFVFSAYSSFLGTIYTASKNTKKILNSTLLSAVSNVSINIVFIPFIGPIIAAWSTLISYVILFTYRLIDIQKYVKLKISGIKMFFSTVLLILQAIIINNIENIELQISINFIIMSIYILVERKLISDILIKSFSVVRRLRKFS